MLIAGGYWLADGPCSMRDEQDVGAEAYDILSLIAIPRPSSGPEVRHQWCEEGWLDQHTGGKRVSSLVHP